MANKFNFKVSYVRITDTGLERYNNIILDDISIEERKDIKSITFLPINSEKVWDISGLLQNFPILEYVYLPSTMTISMKEAITECPMLKYLFLLTENNAENSLSQCVVKGNAVEEDGDNTAEFRAFVTTDKEGRQVFEVNSKQIQNKPILLTIKEVERLQLSQVEEFISGENGIENSLKIINDEIEDDRMKVDISRETLESLLTILVEKGVTFEEFTIDFSKLYDKIESYKTIIKNVNQVSIKEEIEGDIVEAYQRVLANHYSHLVENFSVVANKLCKSVSVGYEDSLINDLISFVINVIVESPDFPADDYKMPDALNSILDILPESASKYLKSSKERGIVRKYLFQTVDNLKNNQKMLVTKIDERLRSKSSIDSATKVFLKKFEIEHEDKQSKKLVAVFIENLIKKDFGSLTKTDVLGMLNNIKSEMKKMELKGKDLQELIKNSVLEYLTENEIKDVLVDFIAENGYETVKLTNA